MAKKKKKVNIDKQLKASEYPMVRNAPPGYPTLRSIKGVTWYERAKRYEQLYGKPVLPIGKEEDGKLQQE